MPMQRRFIPCVGILLVMAACSPDKGFGPSKKVVARDYGSAWPLTVDSAILTCDPTGYLLIQIDGQTFGFDEIADGDVPRRFARVWATDSSQGEARKDLSPLLEDAQALCE